MKNCPSSDELVPIWDSGAQFYESLGDDFDLEVATISM